MATIKVDESENLEKAIKRFKRMVEKEGIIREFKKREYFVKPSAINHQKKVTLERKLLNKKRKTEKKRLLIFSYKVITKAVQFGQIFLFVQRFW